MITHFLTHSILCVPLICCVTCAADEQPPVPQPQASDIAGRWVSEDWGDVSLKQTQPGEYEGTFTLLLEQ